MGSGTTLKVAIELGRIAIGYEINPDLIDVVKKKLKIKQNSSIGNEKEFEIIIRNEVKHSKDKTLGKNAKRTKERE